MIGVDHPDTLMNMHNLAFTWYDMGRHEEAFKMMEDCIQFRIDTLGPEHADTVSAAQALKDWRAKEKDPFSQPRKTRRPRESPSKLTTSTLKSESTPSLRKNANTQEHRFKDIHTIQPTAETGIDEEFISCFVMHY